MSFGDEGGFVDDGLYWVYVGEVFFDEDEGFVEVEVLRWGILGRGGGRGVNGFVGEGLVVYCWDERDFFGGIVGCCRGGGVFEIVEECEWRGIVMEFDVVGMLIDVCDFIIYIFFNLWCCGID